MGLSNLPPGVTDAMIPGNRPEDAAFEEFCDLLDGWLARAQIECNGDQFSELAEAAWDWVSARL